MMPSPRAAVLGNVAPPFRSNTPPCKIRPTGQGLPDSSISHCRTKTGDPTKVDDDTTDCPRRGQHALPSVASFRPAGASNVV